MSTKLSRRLFVSQMLLVLAACVADSTSNQQLQFVVGTISYGAEKEAVEKFSRFCQYLGEKTKNLVQFEPTFNENKALELIKHNSWSLVFAPPGLAALAKDKYQYSPLFSLQTDGNIRSIFIVRKDSPLQQLKDLQGKTVALGLPGSATGYYLPLYHLYGLTLAEILFAPTPSTVLEFVANNRAAAGAMSLEEFNLHRSKFSNVEFRILLSDSQNVPPGAVLISPKIDLNRQELIRRYMQEAPLNIIQDVGYVPNGKIPDYRYMIAVVNRVTSIAKNLNSQPVRLF